jgi:hypothetical protein
MKVKSIYVADTPYSTATIEVPGLGEVTIKDCVSKETYDSLCKEVIFALRAKMGIKEEVEKV